MGVEDRGFASMDPEKQKEIASKGGKAAHVKGTANRFNSESASEAGRKGGQVISRNRQHMSEIGRKGGRASGNRADVEQPVIDSGATDSPTEQSQAI